jgi:starch synthase
MKISFAATNPCHVYPLALNLAKDDALGTYYSGYPAWKLPDSAGLSLRTHSLRTNIVYSLMKFVPERLRPSSRALYLWQDGGFDHWVGAHLAPCDFIHGLPGQCLHTFRAARRLGIRTVLNHATGPVREWVRIMEPEYMRVGLRLSDVCTYDEAYFRREGEEYALADYHCAASTVVRDQLIAQGINADRVWLVPYGADTNVFHRDGTKSPKQFRIVFAGMVGLRKGLKTLLDALTLVARPDWRMEFYGLVLGEARTDLDAYRGSTPLHFHGAVSQSELARAFRNASVLALPSLEEGFGLVVPQALNCGCPVIVSDRVGAKDLVRHRENGSVVPGENAKALAQEFLWHANHPRRADDFWHWSGPAKLLLGKSESAARSAISASARQRMA